jgi:hypothetical protein
MRDGLRVYTPDELGDDGYPLAWHGIGDGDKFALKHLVRQETGHRCIRCRHPFHVGETPGEWSPCDEMCTHGDPARDLRHPFDGLGSGATTGALIREARAQGVERVIEAQWRVLTVHHLDGDKANCRWWNLAALCQRCHLTIQGKVRMDRPWPWPHTEWMRPYVAGFYALKYLSEDLDRDATMARMDELLAFAAREEAIERMPL